MGDEVEFIEVTGQDAIELNKVLKNERKKKLLRKFYNFFGFLFLITIVSCGLAVGYFTLHFVNKHKYIVTVEYSNGDIKDIEFVSNARKLYLNDNNLCAGDENVTAFVRKFEVRSCTELK